ncbi:hypothetical protein SAMN02927914_06243 [Mesorhizobium qingshengii]|uniref:Uncharacterized protein n=1 Tax=Mesorhizobium qingshengii TaxID=1165689 RepID=A0A1G5ZUR7_9HYPH|nr:hypothetical protein SAMN02927914_06243 [Mesorhizobium qingshengii]
MADDFVQLPVGQFEEALGFTVGVVSQPLRAKNCILKGNSERRVVVTHFFAYLWELVFGARKRFETPIGILLQKFCPTFETLAPSRNEVCWFSVNVGNDRELVKCLVLHSRLLFNR